MAAKRCAPRYNSAFTLVEALVALLIFTLITFALTLAISTTLNAHEVTTRHQEQTGTVRAVFGALSRDLQAAHASLGDPSSVFIAGGSQGSGAQSGGSDLLTLTTLSHPVLADELASTTGANGSTTSTNSTVTPSGPQSNSALIRYALDPQSGTLARITSAVPNAQAATQTSPTPADILASNVVSLTLRYWDPTAQSWRETWDYEQQNQPEAANASAQNGTSGTSSSGSTGSGDSTLPTAVEVTLVMHDENPNHPPVAYTTTLSVVATAPQYGVTPTTAPISAATSTTTSGQDTGTGGAASGSGQ